MLRLERQKGQSLRIGDDIKVKVVNISQDKQRVRLEVDAPPLFKIKRSEPTPPLNNTDKH